MRAMFATKEEVAHLDDHATRSVITDTESGRD